METQLNQSPSVNENLTSQPSSLEPQIVPQQNIIPMRTKKRKGKEVLFVDTLLDRFLEEYQKNNFNGTEAMLKVSNVKNRALAASMASKYLKRAENIGKIAMEKKGYSYGKMIDVAIRKMEFSQTPEWWDRLMKLGGYEDFMTRQGVTKSTVSVMNVQKQLIDDYVDGEIVADEGAEQ